MTTTMMIEQVLEELPIGDFFDTQELIGVTEEHHNRLLGMSRPMLHRRKKTDHLNHKESDQLIHYTHLFTHASEKLGGMTGTRSWLGAPTRVFHGEYNHSRRACATFPY